MKSKLIVFMLILAFSLALSVYANTFVYDDFSSNVLDTNKWTISSNGLSYPDEYGIDPMNHNFHTSHYEFQSTTERG